MRHLPHLIWPGELDGKLPKSYGWAYDMQANEFEERWFHQTAQWLQKQPSWTSQDDPFDDAISAGSHLQRMIHFNWITKQGGLGSRWYLTRELIACGAYRISKAGTPTWKRLK